MENNKHLRAIQELKKRYRGYKFSVNYPVLDIGGGDGTFLESQDVKEAIILDATAEKNKRYLYIHADLTKQLPSLNKKFKTIFITEVLEHLENPLYLLAQVYDLLDNDGFCYISVPYTEIGPKHHHVCRWTKKEIINQTRKIGFVPKVIQQRRRFRGLGFWLPHCWLVLALKKRVNSTNEKNVKAYRLRI
jgi:SAM-dependent methyltransferase